MKRLRMLLLVVCMLSLFSCGIQEKVCGQEKLYLKVTNIYSVVVPSLQNKGTYQEGFGVIMPKLTISDTSFFRVNISGDVMDSISDVEGRKLLKEIIL